MIDFNTWVQAKNEGARHTLGATAISAAGMLGGGGLGFLAGGIPGAFVGGLAGKKAGEKMVPDDWKLKSMKKRMKKK